MQNMQAQFGQFSGSITSSLPKYTDNWSRDYTWGPNISRANNGNDFALSRLSLANNCFLIWGRGDIQVNNNGGDQYWETTLTIPWSVNSASLYLSDWHTFKGYFKAYHDATSNNTIRISCSGNNFNGDVLPVNLFIITQ